MIKEFPNSLINTQYKKPFDGNGKLGVWGAARGHGPSGCKEQVLHIKDWTGESGTEEEAGNEKPDADDEDSYPYYVKDKTSKTGREFVRRQRPLSLDAMAYKSFGRKGDRNHESIQDPWIPLWNFHLEASWMVTLPLYSNPMASLATLG